MNNLAKTLIVCVLLGLVSASLLVAYAFGLRQPVSFLYLWLGSTIFFLLYYFLRCAELGKLPEFLMIVACGGFAGLLAEFVITSELGVKGVVSGGLLGVGLGLESLILLSDSSAIESDTSIADL